MCVYCELTDREIALFGNDLMKRPETFICEKAKGHHVFGLLSAEANLDFPPGTSPETLDAMMQTRDRIMDELAELRGGLEPVGVYIEPYEPPHRFTHDHPPLSLTRAQRVLDCAENYPMQTLTALIVLLGVGMFAAIKALGG